MAIYPLIVLLALVLSGCGGGVGEAAAVADIVNTRESDFGLTEDDLKPGQGPCGGSIFLGGYYRIDSVNFYYDDQMVLANDCGFYLLTQGVYVHTYGFNAEAGTMNGYVVEAPLSARWYRNDAVRCEMDFIRYRNYDNVLWINCAQTGDLYFRRGNGI